MWSENYAFVSDEERTQNKATPKSHAKKTSLKAHNEKSAVDCEMTNAMGVLKICIFCCFTSTILTQSFFAFRQPKDKQVAEVMMDEKKRSDNGEPLIGRKVIVGEDQAKRDLQTPEMFFDVSELFDGVMRNFADSTETTGDDDFI